MSETKFPSIDEIRRVCVIGAGTMGHGIAQVAAMAGYEVVLSDISDELVQAGIARIGNNLRKGVARGKVAADDVEPTLARISGQPDLARAAVGVDIAIEAAPESMDLKRQIFHTLDRAAPAHAILASNTSSLAIAEIARSVAEPGRVVGMHFFNPVHIMKLLEVVAHDGSAPAAVETARALGERMNKTPITVRDQPGFASSRLGIALGMEAIRMVEAGVASAADIDTAMKLGYGHPMGPLELTDLVGLDVRLSIAEYLAQELGPRFSPPELLRQKVAAGDKGKKSGAGFYRWQDGKKLP